MAMFCEALNSVTVVCSVLGGCCAGALAAYLVCKYHDRKIARARASRAARRKAEQARLKREQKFREEWAKTMQLGAQGWGYPATPPET